MKINHKESYQDFGSQFLVDSEIDDYWGSKDMLMDIVYPFNLEVIKDKNCMEVGSGSGRILKTLLQFSPQKLVSIEPSDAIEVAKNNIECEPKNGIVFLKIRGEDINIENELDFCFSLGVLHHISDVESVVKNIHRSLKKKGQCVFWLYGFEGNELYVLIFNNLRTITRILPDSMLRILSYLLNLVSSVYIFFCRFIRLPLKDYMLNVFAKCSFQKRRYIIFDQLNPSYAKYYKKIEVEELMKRCGFATFEIFHRHNYSWTVIGTKD